MPCCAAVMIAVFLSDMRTLCSQVRTRCTVAIKPGTRRRDNWTMVSPVLWYKTARRSS
jgi:hypothetical protein